MIKKIILVVVICLISINAWSQTRFQTSFNEKVGQSIVQLNYSWSGFNKTNNNISFNIDKYELQNSYADFKKPPKEDLRNHVNELLKKDIEQINASQNNYKIEMQPAQNSNYFTYRVSGKINKPLVTKIEEALKYREKKYSEDYFKSNYFLWNEKDSLVSIDYSRISKIYIPKMISVANAFKIKNNKDIYNKKVVINDILSFYQSIPYDTLTEDRGEGFSTPLRFLHENKGDCDTKLVAINATVKALYPDVKTIAIILPNHVLMGFAVPSNNNKDKKVMYKGVTYLLTETAGPALIPLGVIDPKNEAVMMTRNYSITEL